MNVLKSVVLLPVLFCLVSSNLRTIYDGVGDLSWRLLGKTVLNGQNTVHSSMSVSKALAMCLLGAEGETLESIKSTMGLANASLPEILAGYKDNTQAVLGLLSSNNTFSLYEANRIFLNESLEVEEKYLRKTKSVFKAYAKRINFEEQDAAQQEINEFVSNATRHTIPTILSDPLSERTVFALVNALYFKGKWQHSMTVVKDNNRYFNDFYCPSITRSAVTWLRLHRRLRYAKSEALSAELVELPYVSDWESGVTSSMVFILPSASKKCDVASWIESVRWETVRTAVEDMTEHDIILTLPEVDIETNIDLADVLVSLGMGEAFSDFANFSKMIKPNTIPVKIDKAIHQAKMKVDMQGTVASAATALTGFTRVLPGTPKPEPIELTLYRTFVSMIVMRHNGTIVPLFSAVINTPSGEHASGIEKYLHIASKYL